MRNKEDLRRELTLIAEKVALIRGYL